MTFSSLVFLTVFFPIVLLGYFCLERWTKAKNVWLIIASLVFYGWSGIQYLLIIVLSSIVNYFFGLLVNRKGKKRSILVCAIVFNLLILGFFKYFNFFTDNLSVVSSQLFGFSLNTPRIPLPIGISFFTFQILSYVVDVYLGKVEPQRNYLRVLLYIVFFPQLIAGPIVRYIDIEREISDRRSSINDVTTGVFRFIRGLCKKVLIANQLALVSDVSFGNIEKCTSGTAWVGIICYTLQIFFDFSGYSDMAIGMGRIFGFHFLENFNYPYIACSIQDFWRRWHISLSSWFKDYVYIPLGGNKKGEGKTYFNLILIFFLTGFWHGAGWNYIIWGLFHGLFQLLERNNLVRNLLKKIPSVIAHIYTILVVMIGWVFFEAKTVNESFLFLKKMFTFQSMSLELLGGVLTPIMLLIILMAILLCTPIIPSMRYWLLRKKPELEHNVFLFIGKTIIAFGGLFFCIVKLATGEFNPFIYFRF